MSEHVTLADIRAVVARLEENRMPDPILIAPSLEVAREMTGWPLEQRGDDLFNGQQFVGKVVPKLPEMVAEAGLA